MSAGAPDLPAASQFTLLSLRVYEVRVTRVSRWNLRPRLESAVQWLAGEANHRVQRATLLGKKPQVSRHRKCRRIAEVDVTGVRIAQFPIKLPSTTSQANWTGSLSVDYREMTRPGGAGR